MTTYHDRAAVMMAIIDCFTVTAEEAVEIVENHGYEVGRYDMTEEYQITECASAMYHMWDRNRPA